ncbi:MAG: PQQ-binding-like beta-propeller repeat protein [Bacteroidetes bacterium]|nr:MAG: PQQ-binding-like beta-propeller repeat protein [Bacteroidota bacterium]
MRTIALLSLLPFLVYGSGPIRFAHVTDTHIGNVTAEEDLRRTVADINAQQGLAFALFTGDITEAGFDDELRIAKRILDSLTVPWYIIPGNHDMKWSGSGGASFARIFGYERIHFDHDGVRFIGLHQGPVLKMGDGHFAPQDVAWLRSVLAGIPSGMPVIFFTHYPLDDEIDNWYEVLDLLKPHDVKAVLYGHGHANRVRSFEGITGIMGRSNLRARQEEGGYNIVEMTRDTIRYRERSPVSKRETLWLTHPLSRTPVAAAPRPSFAVNDSFPRVRPAWKLSTGFTIASTPAVFRNALFVGDASGAMYAYDAGTGGRLWKTMTGGPVYSSPAAADGIVVFGSTDSCLYGLDAKNGKVRWKVKTGAAVVACPVIRKGVAYVGASDGVFRALDIRTGAVRWSYRSVGGFVECVPAVTDDRVVFGAWDEHLYCLDAQNGELMWKWNSGRRGTLLSPAACEPVIAEGRVFIVAPDRFMTAIDLISGETVWRTNRFRVRETIGGSADGRTVFVRTMNDSLYALGTRAAEPDVFWGIDAGFGYDINSAMIKERDGTLYYPTKNGVMLAVDAETGAVRWRHRTGVGVTNTAVPLGGGRVIVTDLDGTVTMLATGP